MLVLNWLAACCAAEKTEEKNPPDPEGEIREPPGVLVSSMGGVRGAAEIEFANLLPPRLAVFGRPRMIFLGVGVPLLGERAGF